MQCNFKAKNPIEEGTIGYDKIQDKYLVYSNGQWKDTEVPRISLYDLNKTAMANVLDITNYIEVKNKLFNYYESSSAKYFMLLSREENYYTLFVKDSPNGGRFENEFIECIENFGTLKALDLTEDNKAIELWVVPHNREDAVVMYLFEYDNGVVQCI